MKRSDFAARQGDGRAPGEAAGWRRAVSAAVTSTVVLAAAIVSALMLSCAVPEPSPTAETQTRPAAEPPPPGTPRLVVLIVVDQMRWDYLDRFGDLYESGLDRLRREAVRFDHTFHRHALTYTAAGHATLVTGRHPAGHGIVANGWRTRAGEEVYAADSPRHGTGPDQLLATTLGEWTRERYPGAKIFAVGGKDRSAVMLGGRAADGAFWYDDESGGFTSSDAYPEPEPEWLAELNEKAGAAALFGRRVWEPLRPDAVRRAEVEGNVRTVDRGRFPRPFPHVPGGAGLAPDEDYFEDLYDTPFLDELTAAVALRLIEAEELGWDEQPDLLGIAFASLDTVGHDWGPDSPEVLDTLLRLDRLLGKLLDRLDEVVGLDEVLVVLSADHGVAPLPEASSLSEVAGAGGGSRMTGADAFCLQSVEAGLAETLGLPASESRPRLLLPAGGTGGFWDHGALEKLGVAPERVEAALRREVEGCPGVERLWTRSELEAAEAPAGVTPELFELYRASHHPERSPDFLVQWKEGFLHLPASTSTTHGTPAAYDRHVPWLIRLPSGEARAVDVEVGTVDVAPTVARLLGVPYPDDLDGRERTDLLP